MAIVSMLGYLVRPGIDKKNPPDVSRNQITIDDPIYEKIERIFDESEHECDIPIAFNKLPDGKQQSEIEKHIRKFFIRPTEANGMKIAERLRNYTTQVTRPGLLFVMMGESSQGRQTMVISRLVAEDAILAEDFGGRLSINYVNRVFVKSHRSYKAALYSGEENRTGAWTGFAVDKQMRRSGEKVADYWIHGFLNSDYRVTADRGSSWFGIALKNATSYEQPLQLKDELISVVISLRNFDQQVVTIKEVLDRLNISEESKREVFKQLPNMTIANSQFTFNMAEFQRYIKYQVVELDNGAIMIAPSLEFDKTFQRESLVDEFVRVSYCTQGIVVDQKLSNIR